MLVMDEVAKDVAVFWNDETFVDLWENACMYIDKLMNDEDCEQEALEAWIALAMYVYIKLYGEDDWKEYAPQWLLEYVDETQSSVNGSPSDNSGTQNDDCGAVVT